MSLEAANEHKTKCDMIYESFANGQNKQFMEQIKREKVDISFLTSFVDNYYGTNEAYKLSKKYAYLAQQELDQIYVEKQLKERLKNAKKEAKKVSK